MARFETGYYKPNMGALPPKVGRMILEIMDNTPAPDRTEMKRRAEEIEARILARQRNEK